jgi:hypothetical protein
MESLINAIVEERIREARARGEFDALPGTGAPLELDDDALVPEDLRAAYRILKNSGFLPSELEGHHEIRKIEQLLRGVEDESERIRLFSRIRFLLNRTAGRRRDLRVSEDYLEKLAGHLADTRRKRIS